MTSTSQQHVTDAVIIMAGSGSRLRRPGRNLLKPLIPIQGRPLISYSLDTLVKAGIETIHAVIGFESDSLRAGIMPLVPAGMKVLWIENPAWQKQNGVSVLAAAPSVNAPFILTMGDHIFEDSVVDLLLKSSNVNELTLAIDRKLNSIFDLDDAMKVQTRENRLIAVGKNLQDYDAIDTGLFVCSPDIFAYLQKAKRDGDCSLADGVRLMAADGKVRTIDIRDAWWQDIDTPEMLKAAEKVLSGSRHRLTPSPAVPRKNEGRESENKQEMQDPTRQS